jgi:hypothetical protein
MNRKVIGHACFLLAVCYAGVIALTVVFLLFRAIW